MAPLPVPKEPLPSLMLPFQTAFALRFMVISLKIRFYCRASMSLPAGGAFDQLRDWAGFRYQRHVARRDLDRVGAHPFAEESLQLRIDGFIVCRYLIEAGDRLPAGNPYG